MLYAPAGTMAAVNPHTRELVFKLVFYGPGLGGKTTTLQHIHGATKAEHRGKMVSIATPTDRTLYFDFLPIRMPKVRGLNVRLQLFTVPGQVHYAATRKLVLSGADGVVFVADSQTARFDSNIEALEDLEANLAEHGRSLQTMPHTFHWNKRDLDSVVPVAEMEARLNRWNAPSLGTVARLGEGVFEGLERITQLVLRAYESEAKVGSPSVSPASISEAIGELVETQAGAFHTPAGGMKAARRVDEDGVELLTVPPPPEERVKSSRPGSIESPRIVAMGDTSVPPPVRGGLGGETSFPPASAAFAKETSLPPSPSIVNEADVPTDSKLEAADPFPSSPVREEVRHTTPIPGRAAAGALSFSELWPETEQERVHQVEMALAARDAVGAVLGCDLLVSRALASAAVVVGSFDAPRDPSIACLLLGLDGTRYLNFRTCVRTARHRGALTMKDALDAFAFAIECRRAREALKTYG